MTIPYQKLRLLPFEASGNRTPVLDVSCISGITTMRPQYVRAFLQTDKKFRRWLQSEGRRMFADSIMICYQSTSKDYNYVMFVGEPNASLQSDFSDMCGNGLRALGLYIALNNPTASHIQDLKVWAGETKSVRVEMMPSRKEARVSVDMGPFQTLQSQVQSYIRLHHLQQHSDLAAFQLPNNLSSDFLRERMFGLGFNSNTREGEPHLVLLNTLDQFEALSDVHYTNIQENPQPLLTLLRWYVCQLGRQLTFAEELFPKGINVNIGVCIDNTIFMATHERNLIESREHCIRQQQQRVYCQCNTLACGTGGSAVANIAKLQGFITSKSVQTIQPGGTVRYSWQGERTIMEGEARATYKQTTILSRNHVDPAKTGIFL